MAFNNAAKTLSNVPAQERAALWMNVYCPIEGDSRKQVAGIPLMLSKELHAAIIEQCSTEEGQAAFVNSLQFEFNSGASKPFKLAC
jgi:hypothetical protein